MNKIIKSKFDNRNYYANTLENGIKYIIINDKLQEKSQVSVAISVGSYSNPLNYDGLAHFLEHMLFMGSKTYPIENYYYTKLSELGGNSNAYTSGLETVYYFNTFNDGLKEMMDIFSHFFIDPLFKKDAVNREMNAVNNEHLKNINNDSWIKRQFICDLTDKNSGLNTFITGSLNTLNKKDIREKMIEFYNKYYVPNNISITICSSLPINDINKLIEDKFNRIKKNKNKIKFPIKKPIFTDNIGKTFHLKSKSKIKSLILLYEIANITELLYNKAFDIFSFVINRNGPKSINFQLKKIGLIDGLEIEISEEGFIQIIILLTEYGFNNLNFVEKIVIDYIEETINNTDWFKAGRYYKNLTEKLFECNNKFDNETLCNILSTHLHYYEPNKTLKMIYTFDKIEKNEYYKNLFNKYINKNKLIRIIHSRKINNLDNNNFSLTREYNAKYREINYDLLKDKDNLKTIKINLNNDYTNNFLNNEIKLIKGLDKYTKPIQISERYWYGANSSFSEPNINMVIHLSNKKYYLNPINYILTNISCIILNLLINNILYKPLETCYSINIEPSIITSGININISGTNNPILLNKLVEQIEDFLLNINDEVKLIGTNYIKYLIKGMEEQYYNINKLNPSIYASYLINAKSLSSEYKAEEIINSLRNIDSEAIILYINNLLLNTSLTTIIYGNIEINSVPKIIKLNKLVYNSLSPLPQIKPLHSINIQHPNKKENSNFISIRWNIGTFEPKKNVLLFMVTNILSQSFFDVLRTKLQLGYLVSLGTSSLRENWTITERVQSNKSVSFVLNKMDQWNRNILKYIEKIDFNQYKSLLEKELSEPDTNLFEKWLRYRPEIIIRQYLFNRKELLLKALKEINKDDLVEWIKQYMNDKNKITIIIEGNKETRTNSESSV